MIVAAVKNSSEMLPGPPSWILRWGMLILPAILVLFFSAAALIRYPDTIRTRGIITSAAWPSRLVAPADGYIDSLYAREGQFLQKGAPILTLQDEVHFSAARRAEHLLDSLLDLPARQWPSALPPRPRLGPFSADYRQISHRLQELKAFRSRNPLWQQMRILQRQHGKIERLNESLGEQRKVLLEIADLALRDLSRMEDLNNREAVSLLEREKAEITYLQYRRQEKSLATSQIDNQVRMEDIQLRIEQLAFDLEKMEEEKLRELNEHMTQLLSLLRRWKARHLLPAPGEGRLTFLQPLQPGARVSAQSALASIIPASPTEEPAAVANLPFQKAGKVESGMQAQIYLDAYPHREYGILQGRVSYISDLPQTDGYAMRIQLNEGLLTSFDRNLSLREEMPADIRIITRKRSLLSRLFDILKSPRGTGN